MCIYVYFYLWFFVVISIYNVCLCYIHCLFVMEYLVKPECWTSIKLEVLASRKLAVVVLVAVVLVVVPVLFVTSFLIY